ncbi:MAG: glycosyltransferase family 2 protein [Oligoflexia bacterium]|nr:glycosyltransferase family 2 protein [Oligoflexia bacterium]
MFEGQSVSVVMPAYNEECGIEETVRGFISHHYVDEVIVADNNSNDRTAELARAAGALVVSEARPGYGNACITALRAAKGNLVVLTESDCSFYPQDLNLLLAYSPFFDMVKGARSNRNLIVEHADWTFLLMIGNWLVAKCMQALYFGSHAIEESSLREMGGTYRVIRRDALSQILPLLSEGGSAFLADLTSIAIRKKFRILEIPVRYRQRLGTSKITGSRWIALKVAIRMLWIIARNRIRKFE